MNKVYYLELDVVDNTFKQHSSLRDSSQYVCGELFIGSPNETPLSEYKAKVHYNEKIDYFSLIAISESIYALMANGKFELPFPILFKAVRTHNVIGNYEFTWILREICDTSLILDDLEEQYGFNVLGDAGNEEMRS